VEPNALRARLPGRAQHWRWGGSWRRLNRRRNLLLPVWPEYRRSWLGLLDGGMDEAELEAVRVCGQRGLPYGVFD